MAAHDDVLDLEHCGERVRFGGGESGMGQAAGWAAEDRCRRPARAPCNPRSPCQRAERDAGQGGGGTNQHPPTGAPTSQHPPVTAYSMQLITFMSLWVARLPTLRCTNTSPGPRPSSSLAGTRESEHPILQLQGGFGGGWVWLGGRQGARKARKEARRQKRGGEAGWPAAGRPPPPERC